MSLFITCLLIASVRIVDVSLGTLRMVLTIRGKRGIGSLIGFVEVLVWFLIVRRALTAVEGGLFIAVSYAGGFAIGTYIGIWLEEKLAIGNVSIQVITKGKDYNLVKALRKEGYAVSTIITKGKDQENLLLLIEVSRRQIKKTISLINELAKDSFITVSETRHIIGGYFHPENRRRFL